MPADLPTWLQNQAKQLSSVPQEDAGYALPAGSLKLLEQMAAHLGIKRVFEFGSGRSTGTFLQAGCEVVSLEDSNDWLGQTREALEGLDLARWTPYVHPLELRWDGGAPFQSWQLNGSLREELSKAQLVLIDSPAHPPSREMALLDTLRSGHRGLIVMDDAGIPTLRRFCERLCRANAALRGNFLDLDHGLFVVDARNAVSPLHSRRGLIETLKAWRRYFH